MLRAYCVMVRIMTMYPHEYMWNKVLFCSVLSLQFQLCENLLIVLPVKQNSDEIADNYYVNILNALDG